MPTKSEPTEPVSGPLVPRAPSFRARHAERLVFIAVGLVFGICALVMGITLHTMTKSMNDLAEAMEHVVPMQPPSNDKLFTVVTKGLGVSENVVATSQVGTTAASAFATDLTTVQQTDAWTQEIVITNRDDTDNLCFKPIAWASAGANCSAKCIAAAATITCPAASAAGTTATDGTVTPPGGSWPRRYDGTSCICIVGSAANTAYQTERVLRRRSKRRLVRRRFRMTRRVL